MTFLRPLAALLFLALPAQAEVPIKEVTSPGGITAWLVESHDIPFTALDIRFKGGTSLDAEGKRGATNLMTALLEEGAGDMDASAFATARDDLAAEFRFSSNSDAVAVSARFLTENRDQAADLLHLALTEPRFDDNAIQRVRAQVLSGIRSAAQDPDAIAGDTFNAEAFGPHPYGSDDSGTLDSVAALTRDDLVAAQDGALARDRIYVAAAGDISEADLGALLDRILGDLPATGAPQPGPAEWRATGGTTVVDFPTPQAVVRFGQPGIDVHDPDFMAAFVANEVLGGGRFTARLMDELRTQRGLTYGASAYLASLDHADMIVGQFASDNDKVAEAVDVTKQVWEGIAQDGITQEELDAAKTYLTGSYPLRFDGNGPIAGILVGMQMQGFPIDYPTTRNARIEALTLDEVNRVAKTLYDPSALRFVVVGQPQGLE
ncbi:M16 family metallopeptidase [Falsirhodobacter halotolerans]|uniref:M16 family metallopeptidase n=1 Tax=Falsirhodobacter halotolerans TaxID=1146892 RepID=UPI001FD0A614|nr:pitrilysin family protein [Falsirhodobacter halotolerans]MCJ8140728.1 insulinase family protein [Falsirhodobacter halotolerans]